MAQSGKARSCELRDPWRVSRGQIPTPAFQIKEVNPQRYLRLEISLTKMINACIQYKTCAVNGAIIKCESRSFSRLKPKYSRTCYHDDLVQTLNKLALSCKSGSHNELRRRLKDVRRIRFCADSRPYIRTTSADFEKHRKTMTRGQAGREWYLNPASSSLFYTSLQSRNLVIAKGTIEYGCITIQAFCLIQSCIAASMAILMLPFFIPNRAFTSFLNCLSKSSSIVRMIRTIDNR